MNLPRAYKHFCILMSLTTGITTSAYANEASTTLYGPLGLNTIPSARMDQAGTLRAGVGTLDPYINSWLGFQLADPLSITIRQSAEISNLNEDADRLYPGVDFKLRLMEETSARPELSIGLQSAIGHKRMAGEYIAASKRYKDFDFTAGIGWGRFGTAGHFKNPLKIFGGHFEKGRALDGEMPNRPDDWFTGEDIGLFGGIEYFTPIDGLSLKFDYGADRYAAEKAAFDFNSPASWAVGLNYKPAPWVDMAIGMQGTDKIMGRISLQNLLQDWKASDADYAPEATPFRPYRTGLALPSEMQLAAAGENAMLYNVATDARAASGQLVLHNEVSTPRQIGLAAKHIANHGGQDIERIDITPTRLGLYGPTVRLSRTSLENAAARNEGSAEEIWHDTEFITTAKPPHHKQRASSEFGYGLHDISIKLDSQTSLSEEDSGALYRSSLIVGTQAPDLFGWMDNFLSLRLNLKDNLHRLDQIRPRVILPVRSDVDRFAKRRVALDTAFSAFTHSFRSDLHLSFMGGYLEEMYGGVGGELLYRPHDARWALGAESFLAFKRDPDTSLNLGFTGDRLLSGHVNGWYDLPLWDLTLNAKIGRYLAEDIGGTLALQKRFDNGVLLEGFTTVTDQSDFDLFGDTTHADHGIRLSLPLGGFKYTPQNTRADFAFEPFGRDIGQKLENPLPLYDVTESFSTRHMAAHWEDITP